MPNVKLIEQFLKYILFMGTFVRLLHPHTGVELCGKANFREFRFVLRSVAQSANREYRVPERRSSDLFTLTSSKNAPHASWKYIIAVRFSHVFL